MFFHLLWNTFQHTEMPIQTLRFGRVFGCRLRVWCVGNSDNKMSGAQMPPSIPCANAKCVERQANCREPHGCHRVTVLLACQILLECIQTRCLSNMVTISVIEKFVWLKTSMSHCKTLSVFPLHVSANVPLQNSSKQNMWKFQLSPTSPRLE